MYWWTDQSKDKTWLALEKKTDKKSTLLKQICRYFYWKTENWGFCASETLFLFVPRGWLWLCSCYSAQLCGTDNDLMNLCCFHVLLFHIIVLSVMVQGARKWTFDSWASSVGMWLIIGITVVFRDIIWNKIKILPVWDNWRKKSNSAYVLVRFHHCFLLSKCGNEWIDLNPFPPGHGSFKHSGAGGVWHQLGLSLENNSGTRGSSKAPFEGHFLMEVLWNSEELKWWKVALVCERRQMIASSVLLFVICGSFSWCID